MAAWIQAFSGTVGGLKTGYVLAGRISPEKGLEDAVAAARALGMPLDVCGQDKDTAYGS